MRGLPLVALMVLVSSAAIAQTPAASPPPSTSPSPTAQAAPPAAVPVAAPQGIARDDYIEHAKERAAKAAAKRFDAMDANHDGILTREEVAAYRAAHPRRRKAPAE